MKATKVKWDLEKYKHGWMQSNPAKTPTKECSYQGDPDYIRYHHTKTPSPDGGPPIYHNYECKEEMHNWIRALQDRKIDLNDERTQSNDKKRQEIKGREEMLKSENILVTLSGERNFVIWLDAINKVFNDAPTGTSDFL